MAKLIKKKKANRELAITLKGKIKKHKERKTRVLKEPNGAPRNGKSKKSKDRKLPTVHALNEDQISIVKKKPSKVELKQVIELLKKEPKSIVVRKALKYIPHYLKSEGLTKKLLKEIINLWAEAGEKVRVVCLLCLIRIYSKKEPLRQLIIKKLYNTFLEKSRVTKDETIPLIKFMRSSLIELYKLDSDIAFKQAQQSVQQSILTLKNANLHKNETSYKTVLNWQFANCLILLSNLIMSLDDDSPVKSLTQKVIQLNLGAIEIVKSPRYYPFYCHLIENLIGLSEASGFFIPTLPLLVGIVDQIQVVAIEKKSKRPKKHAKPNGTNLDVDNSPEEADEKTYDMDLLNHVKIEETQHPNYKLAVLEKTYDLILRYLANQSHRIAFPELVLLPCVQLKKWLKRNPSQETQKFKTLLDKIKADCETIEKMRTMVDFAFTNYAAVDAWEKRLRDSNRLILPKMLVKD